MVEEMFMSTKVTKLAVRAYLVLMCAATPVAVLHAQSGAAGSGQAGAGQGTGTGTAGTTAGQPGTAAGGAAGTGTAGAGNGSAAGGQDLGYAQTQDNGNNNRGGSKAGWLGLLGLFGLLGLRNRNSGTTVHTRDTAPSYETTGARRP
jgi:hypothetical protein